MKTRTIAMLLAVALVAHVRGQEDQTVPNLTKAEEGRVAISQCEAMDVARINSKVKVLKSHFITQDNVAAFDAHVAALEAKHRGQACAMASGILAELATHFADWTV